MDGSRFDLLARAVAGGRTRRGFLGGLAALAAGAVGLRAAEAKCPPGATAASGGRCVCKSTGRQPAPTGCPCLAGQSSCDGGATCKDLSSDVANCGACGAPCVPGPNVAGVACLGGACVIAACANGYKICGGACIPVGGCCSDAECDFCTCQGCDPVTHTCVSRCDPAAGQACSGGECITVCPGEITCYYNPASCAGPDCGCAGECLNCCCHGNACLCGDTGTCDGTLYRCCCDAVNCSCHTPDVACCPYGDGCLVDGMVCCINPQGEQYACRQWPIFVVAR